MFQYSFANVDLIITADWQGNNNPKKFKVEGFAAGENLISINRKAPLATTTFGAYGDMVVSMQRIKAGDLVFPVLMNSVEGKYLQDYVNHFQEIADGGGELIIPIQAVMKDNMGKDAATMTNGVILAIPAMVRGQTINTDTWVITFETIQFLRDIGGDFKSL